MLGVFRRYMQIDRNRVRGQQTIHATLGVGKSETFNLSEHVHQVDGS